MSKLPKIENEAIAILEGTLSAIPKLQFEILQSENADLYVHLNEGKRGPWLVCEVKSRAWSNEIVASAHRFQRIYGKSRNHLPLLIAPYFSATAAQTCNELGINWLDFAGNCDIRLPNSYIHIEGKPNPHAKGRETASLYSPKSSQVVHALLAHPKKNWITAELAEASQTSLAQVSAVKKRLAQQNWIEAGYGKLILTDPLKLLQDWARHYERASIVLHYFTLDRPEVLEAKLGAGTALTEFSAAERYSPYTRYQTVAFYAPNWNGDDVHNLDLRPANGTPNVTVYRGKALFTEEINGATVASPIQTYLDLTQIPNRGPDAAEHLLETTILPRWR